MARITYKEFKEAELPKTAEVRGHYFSILWKWHLDGTVSFASLRITKETFDKIKG